MVIVEGLHSFDLVTYIQWHRQFEIILTITVFLGPLDGQGMVEIVFVAVS